MLVSPSYPWAVCILLSFQDEKTNITSLRLRSWEVWPEILAALFFETGSYHYVALAGLGLFQASFKLNLVCPLTCGSSSPLYYLLLLGRWNRHAHPGSQPGLSLGWSLGPFLLLAAQTKTKSTNGEKSWKRTAPGGKPGLGSMRSKTVKVFSCWQGWES